MKRHATRKFTAAGVFWISYFSIITIGVAAWRWWP